MHITPNQYKLVTLKQRQDLLPIIANWWYQEFGYLNPERTMVEASEELITFLNTDRLPVCYLLLKNNNLVGTASLTAIDIESYDSVSPWLASVIISPQYRGQGMGTLLVQEVMKAAKKLHAGHWYLYTPDRESFYERMGWEKIDKTDYNGVTGVIMKSPYINHDPPLT